MKGDEPVVAAAHAIARSYAKVPWERWSDDAKRMFMDQAREALRAAGFLL